MISKDITTNINQHRQCNTNANASNTKNKIKQMKLQHHHDELSKLQNNLSDNKRRLLELNQEQGASSGLTTLPITDEGYDLTKQLFWDLIWIRFGWALRRLPTSYECGARFDLQHAFSCKKGGFIFIRHNQIRNITARLLKEVFKDIHVEPQLQRLVKLFNHQLLLETKFV